MNQIFTAPRRLRGRLFHSCLVICQVSTCVIGHRFPQRPPRAGSAPLGVDVPGGPDCMSFGIVRASRCHRHVRLDDRGQDLTKPPAASATPAESAPRPRRTLAVMIAAALIAGLNVSMLSPLLP